MNFTMHCECFLFMIITINLFIISTHSANQSNLNCVPIAIRKYMTKKLVFLDTNNAVMYTLFSGFNKFSDLISNSTCAKKTAISNLVEFKPNKLTIIDDAFNKLVFDAPRSTLKTILIVNSKGIENSKRLMLHLSEKQEELVIAFSHFDFYLNSTLISESDCGKLLGARQFFANIDSLTLEKVKYPKFLCPTVFKNFKLTRLVLTDITHNLIKSNTLRILNMSQHDDDNYQNSIDYLLLYVEYVTLDSTILNRFVFSRVMRLHILGTLNKIETSLFADFVYLRRLELSIDNLKDFIHQDNAWMSYLNK